MMTKTWAFACIALTLACSKRLPNERPIVKDTTEVTAASVAAPGADSASARGFQKSYDEEALGHLDAALAALDDAPSTPNAVYVATLRRGWLLYRLGKSTEAVAAYRRTMTLAPASIEAKVGVLAPLAVLRLWNDVEAAARDVLRKDPANYQATIRLAFALYSQARFGEAAATYSALLAAYPSDVDAGAGVGWSLLKMGKSADAAAAFARVLEIAPQNALALDGAKAAKVSP